MSAITLKELATNYEKYADMTVETCGWVRTIRDSKNFAFIELSDGTYFKTTQIIADSDLDNYKTVISQNVGAGISVVGTVVLTPQMKQPFEIKAQKIVIEATSTPSYPLQKKRHTMEYLREIAHLRPRANTFQAVFKVRSVAAQAIHAFFASRNFVYVNTPLITTSDCEGAGEMFKVTTLDLKNPPMTKEGDIDYSKDFFGKSAGLTVSGQDRKSVV